MLKYVLLFAILIAQVAFAQKRVAVLNTEDDGEPPIKFSDLNVLTSKLRDIATKALPLSSYAIMTEQSVLSYLGSQKEVERVCESANGCLAKIGREIDADYVGQARLNRFGKFFSIKMEVYDVKSGTLIGSFTDEMSKDIYALLGVIEKKAPEMFNKMVSDTKPAQNTITKSYDDGKKYKSVKIGNQVWMAKNLNIDVEGSKCYNNQPANCDKYGRLYTWEMAKTACPRGWHLPTKAEWEVMTKYIGGERTEGKYLKAKSGWNKNGNGQDKFGFAALPGGDGGSGGYFVNVGSYGGWWSASEYNASDAYRRSMSYSNEGAYWKYISKAFLQSVRCVQD